MTQITNIRTSFANARYNDEKNIPDYKAMNQEKEEKRLERNRKAREYYWQKRLVMHTNLNLEKRAQQK